MGKTKNTLVRLLPILYKPVCLRGDGSYFCDWDILGQRRTSDYWANNSFHVLPTVNLDQFYDPRTSSGFRHECKFYR